MRDLIAHMDRPTSAFPLNEGGRPLYHRGETNRCPGCGRSHWYIGRITAECGFCATALILADGGTNGAGLFRVSLPARAEAA